MRDVPRFPPRRGNIMRCKYNSPVFCDNCPTLALATLDGQHLCSGCLLAAIAGERESDAIERIMPIGHRPRMDADRQSSDDVGCTGEMPCVEA